MKINSNSLLEQAVNRMDISICQSGDVTVDSVWRQKDVCSPYSRLYYVYGGAAWLYQGKKALPLEPGRVYLVPAGMRFDYACENRMSKLYFHFNLLKTDGYDVFMGLERIGVLPVAAERLQKLRACYSGCDMTGIWTVKSILYETVTEMLAQYPESRRRLAVYSPVVQNTIEYIRHNLSLQLSVDELAEKMFVSKSFLGKRFREEVGVPPSRYIDDQIFFAAQWQLLKTDQSIAEISEQFGFCDQFYFSRRFKQKYGETPNRYRCKIRSEKFSDFRHDAANDQSGTE